MLPIVSKRFYKYGIAFLILAALIFVVDVQLLWEALSQLTVEVVVYLLLLSVVLIYVSALKWKIFLDALGAKASLMRLFNLYLVGYFVNLLMPSYLGGDAVRSWYIGKKVGQHEALAATILERYTGFVAMISLGLVFMWQVELVTFEIKLAVLLVSLGLVGVTVLALSERLLVWLPSVSGRFRDSVEGVVNHLRKVQQGFLLARSNKKLLFQTLLLSFLFHTVTVVNTIAAAYAVGWYNPPIWELFVVLPLVLLIGAVPISPSGLGIQEGAFLFFLSGIGATPAQALGVGIVLRAKLYVLAVIGGFIWLYIKADTDPESSDPNRTAQPA